jgi:electron transfer flavoprotein alpha subunit
MRIVVCIKQVPFVDQLTFDPIGKRIVREGVGAEINPYDRRAITAAVNLRKQFGGEVIVITMGPPQATDALVEALAMGCDRAIHLLGREFAGADTLATARALALACIKTGFDLILCGKNSTDAETAQVPVMMAEILGIPQVTRIVHLEFSDARQFTAKRELDDGYESVQSSLPVLLTASERLVKPIRIAPQDLEPARQKPIDVWGAQDLSNDAGLFGVEGSPTLVSEIFSIEPKRTHIVRLAEQGLEQVVQSTIADLDAEGAFRSSALTQTQPPGDLPKRLEMLRDRAIWVIAELTGDVIRPVTYELMGRSIELAQTIDGEMDVVLIGSKVQQHVKTLAAHGADKIYIADAPALAAFSTEAYASVLTDAIRRYDPFAVLIPSTGNGRDFAPRVAARLGVGLTGDCIGVEIDSEGRQVQLKPAFGGNIIAPIISRTRPAMATIRPGMMATPAPDSTRQATVVDLPTIDLGESRIKTISVECTTNAGIALDDAEIILGVGLGIGGPESLPQLQELAEMLGAQISASRKVVDAGWLPPQVQVGLTGRSVAPRLYIAVGISGKFNHMVGIQRARSVLAINQDPNADIFKQCDYGIVGDWKTVVPALISSLRNIGL